jgi:hypothetical protein
MSLWVMAVRELVRAHSEPIFCCRRHHAYVESWFSSLKQARGKDWGNILKTTCFWSFLDRQARVEKGMALEFLGLDSTTHAAQVLIPLGQKCEEESMATFSSACPHTAFIQDIFSQGIQLLRSSWF